MQYFTDRYERETKTNIALLLVIQVAGLNEKQRLLVCLVDAY